MTYLGQLNDDLIFIDDFYRETNMKKPLILLMLSSLALTVSTTTQAAEQTTQDTKTHQSHAKRASGVWIDVRTPEEYQQGHLSNTYNVIPQDIAMKIASIEPNKHAPINLYCRSGRRAEVARKTLMDLGYTNVTNHGGYQELYSKGLR